jgi:hypothetical protein
MGNLSVIKKSPFGKDKTPVRVSYTMKISICINSYRL